MRIGEHQKAHQEHKAAWFIAVDLLLNIDQYALTFFEVSGRLHAAEVAMKKATGHDLDIATAWHSRVLRWSENIDHDLRSDAVPAPRGLDAHWMLYIPKKSPPRSANFTGECADEKLEVADSFFKRLLH